MHVTHLAQCFIYGKNSVNSYEIIITEEWHMVVLNNYFLITK